MTGEVSIKILEGNDEYELPAQTVSAIGEIAARYQLNLPSAIAQSIINEKFFLDLEANGYRLVIKPRRGRMRYLERR